MKTYLLLRNNRQKGPYTLAEILMEGLKPQDLVWVEGQSSSWRYPSELDELKAHVPPPALDATLDLGFIEVQNRVVPNRAVFLPVIAETLEAPLTPASTGKSLIQAPIAAPRFPVMPAAASFHESAVPAFDALAGLLPDEDLMPTMAWQAPSNTTPAIAPADVQQTMGAAVPVERSVQTPPDRDLRKIRVVLPAAVADKTMVVIRRRDLAGKPVSEPWTRSRRPVLEFITEDTEIAPVTMPVNPLSIPAEQSVNQEQVIAETGPTTVETAQKAIVTAVALPEVKAVEETETFSAEAELSVPGSTLQSSIAGELQPHDQQEHVTPAFLPQGQPAPTLQVNVNTMQKIAVIVAIISLLAVTLLIANSIFNPNAYQYGTKPGKQASEKVSTPAAKGTVKP